MARNRFSFLSIMVLDLTLLEWLASLIAGGSVVVGGGVAIALLRRREGLRLANVAMGLLLAVAASALLHELIANVRPVESSWTIIFLPLLYTYSIGPLLYTYVYAKLNSSKRISKWHYALPMLQGVLTIGLALSPLSLKAQFMNIVYAPWYSAAEDVIFTTSFTAYLLLSHQVIKHAQKSVRFDWELQKFIWLRRLVIGGAVILAVSIFFNIASPLYYVAWGGDLYQYEWVAFIENLAYSTLLYWLTIGGFVQALPSLQNVMGQPAGEIPLRKESYNLAPNMLTEHIAALEQLIEKDSPFLDADLALATLAKQLGVTDKVLSYVLNEGLGISYVDYVNGLRVEEAKRLLADPATDHLTVLSIGLDAGFSSKATFNRVFKRISGITPSEYRNAASPALS